MKKGDKILDTAKKIEGLYERRDQTIETMLASTGDIREMHAEIKAIDFLVQTVLARYLSNPELGLRDYRQPEHGLQDPRGWAARCASIVADNERYLPPEELARQAAEDAENERKEAEQKKLAEEAEQEAYYAIFPNDRPKPVEADDE